MQTIIYGDRNERTVLPTSDLIIQNKNEPNKNDPNDMNGFAVYLPDGNVMVAYDDAFPKLAKEYTPTVMRNLTRHEFVPIVIHKEYGKIYRCPCCGALSGTLAPLNPRRVDLFQHARVPRCLNINKIPVEE